MSTSSSAAGRLEKYMKIALEEARTSLREGDNGFGAVLVADDDVIATAHDTEETHADPTAHAEMAAIRRASLILGKDLSACSLVCTHEPCPMCAAAVVSASISCVVFGYGIADAIAEGRPQIAIPCQDIFDRVNARVAVVRGVLNEECAVLYRQDVRAEVKRLRGTTDDQLQAYDMERAKRRIEWFRTQSMARSDDLLETAYDVLLRRLGINPAEAPVVRRNKNSLTFHSMNFCPTLAACEILGLDTRKVCEQYNFKSPNSLVKELDPRLEFIRSYNNIRPYSDYCEETIRFRHAI